MDSTFAHSYHISYPFLQYSRGLLALAKHLYLQPSCFTTGNLEFRSLCPRINYVERFPCVLIWGDDLHGSGLRLVNRKEGFILKLTGKCPAQGMWNATSSSYRMLSSTSSTGRLKAWPINGITPFFRNLQHIYPLIGSNSSVATDKFFENCLKT